VASLEPILLDEPALKHDRVRGARIDFEPACNSISSRGNDRNSIISEEERHMRAGPTVMEISCRRQRQCPAPVIEPDRETREQVVAEDPGQGRPSTAIGQEAREGQHGQKQI
jgi:hypothetical protein